VGLLNLLCVWETIIQSVPHFVFATSTSQTFTRESNTSSQATVARFRYLMYAFVISSFSVPRAFDETDVKGDVIYNDNRDDGGLVHTYVC
jgi:hypothetical protein